MKTIKSYFKADVAKINIKWSIHCVSKTIKKGKAESLDTKYMTVKKVGRRKETLMHNTLALAMVEIGL